jgi:hypothetical protein
MITNQQDWFLRDVAMALLAVTFIILPAHADQQLTTKNDNTIRMYNGINNNELYVRLTATQPEIEDVSSENPYAVKGDVAVHMESFGLQLSPGNPMLPYKVYQFALPPDVVADSVSFEITRRVDKPLEGSFTVAPAPSRDRCQEDEVVKEPLSPEEQWGGEKDIVNGRNVQVYDSDTVYPAEVCRVHYAGQMRKWKIGEITFHPVQYNPVRRQLSLIRELDVKIMFQRDASLLNTPATSALLRDTVFDTKARSLLQNYKQASHWYLKPVLQKLQSTKADSEAEDPNFAIITTESTFTNATGEPGLLDEFCFHKENLGYEVMVVTEHKVRTVEHNLLSGYSFADLPGFSGYEDVVGAPAPNERPDKIYTWLRNNYLSLGIEYVLLIGNPDPDNLAAGDTVGDLPMKNLILSSTSNIDCPTDFYFAELTGTWDLDGDGNAGEYIDDKGPGGVEFYADLIVGRIPVYDEDQNGVLDYAELNSILDKIIGYENAAMIDVPWRRSVLATAPYVVDTNGDGIHDTAKYEWAELLRDTVAPPMAWEWYRIYEEPYVGLTTPAEVDTGCSFDAMQSGWNIPGDPDDGRGVAMWMTHGLQTFASKTFSNDRCANLDDTKPSFVFMGACHNGEPRFNPPNGIPLGYANLKQGAIATISASRDSYG